MRWLPAVLLASCAFATDGSESVHIVTLNDAQEYEPRVVEVELLSLDPLASDRVRFFYGGAARFGSAGLVRLGGEEPYVPRVERALDGSLVPTDYAALLGFCALYHFQLADAYAESLMSESVRSGAPYDVMLNFSLDLPSPYRFDDNMAYLRGQRTFVISRSVRIESLPLACNAGIVAHEFAHAIADQFEGLIPIAGLEGQAIDEGFSDVFAAGFLNLPHFIDTSVLELTLRRLDEVRIDDPREEAPHLRGAVLSSVFWAYRDQLVAAGMEPREASDTMVRLALRTHATIAQRPIRRIREFIAQAALFAEDRAAFCVRAEQSYPVAEVTAACE